MFTNTKPGDTMALMVRGELGDFFAKVQRVTNQRIVTQHGTFRRSDGREVPFQYYTPRYIRPATEEDMAELEYRLQLRKVENFVGWRRLPRTAVEQIYDILKAHEAKANGEGE